MRSDADALEPRTRRSSDDVASADGSFGLSGRQVELLAGDLQGDGRRGRRRGAGADARRGIACSTGTSSTRWQRSRRARRSCRGPIGSPTVGTSLPGDRTSWRRPSPPATTRFMDSRDGPTGGWVSTNASRAVLSLPLHPRAGYPFALALRTEYALGADGLTVRTAARNVGRGPAPHGAGFHPYLTVGADELDRARLQVPATTRLELDERGIPTGRRLAPDGGEHDLGTPRAIGTTRLETGVRRSPARRGRPRPGPPGVRRRRPGGHAWDGRGAPLRDDPHRRRPAGRGTAAALARRRADDLLAQRARDRRGCPDARARRGVRERLGITQADPHQRRIEIATGSGKSARPCRMGSGAAVAPVLLRQRGV